MDLTKLTWTAVWKTEKGFPETKNISKQDRRNPEPENSKTIHKFPVPFTEFFPILPNSGVHEVLVKTEFELSRENALLKIPTGIFLPDIGENWRLELNGKILREEWFPIEEDSLSRKRSLKGVTIPIEPGLLKVGTNKLQIEIRGESPPTPYVPNDHFGFYHSSGYRISSLEDIYEQTSEYLDIFLFGIYTIFGIYHILFFRTRTEDSYYLYFGLFSLLSSVYFYSTTNHIANRFINFVGGPDSGILYRLEFSSLIPMVPMFLLFAKEFFYQKEGKFWMIRILGVLSIFFFLGMWVLPFRYLLVNLRLFQFLLIPMLLYVLFFTLQTIRKKRPDAGKMAIGIAICASFGIWDTLDAIYKIIGIHYPYFKIAYLTFILVIISLLVSRYVSLYKESQELNLELAGQRDAFYRFVPSEFISILDKKDPVEIRIGDSKEKSMSVIFADLKGFTSLSERLTPEENIKYLNQYFSTFEEIIFRNSGFVDKYVGDAILALFSDYSPRAEKEKFNSADNVLQSAIDMVKVLHSLGDSAYGAADLGIGINTGPLILGTVGSNRRIDTTVIGDTVNLASRVQSLTSFYKTRILITHHTFLRLNLLSEVRAREIDTVIVKGKTQPVVLYEVYEADPPEFAAWKDRVKDRLNEGISLYKSKKFRDSFLIFREMYKEHPHDSVVRLYAKRTKLFLKQAPSEDWDGIFRLHRK
ncbi:adenylate/guanylate cyclase domain-containing protein [Leptospira perolatii]|uniref:Adenylate/guanylate cyclase domain-containing protein n=1 Tax=Leptospira perolatii TaxID=2023191 RepID=A0A2M9ZT67_9LEPT|nr:adenylate/guanylate cyclase domain-containing protein [Leptospira perolatii]PJZ75169.1 adenylate/guanylate cyclase domain-containing protein [Leptospira perolatii]